MKNPHGPENKPQAHIDSSRCDGCALCIDVCPAEALHLVRNPIRPGKLIVQIRSGRCVGCGLCQGTCPKEAVSVTGFSPSELRRKICEALDKA
jgi:ferredoxin